MNTQQWRNAIIYDVNGNPVTFGSGGTASTDETPFSAGVSVGTPLMGVVTPSDSPPSGDLAIVALDASRNLKIAGSFSSTPVQSNASSAVGQTTVGGTAVTLLASNSLRKRLTIQNTGTTVIYLAFAGKVPTVTQYHRALAACGQANDGSSAPYDDVMETGAVQAISSAAGGTVVVEERT
jgi:hypothetical protein